MSIIVPAWPRWCDIGIFKENDISAW